MINSVISTSLEIIASSRPSSGFPLEDPANRGEQGDYPGHDEFPACDERADDDLPQSRFRRHRHSASGHQCRQAVLGHLVTWFVRRVGLVIGKSVAGHGALE